MSIKYIPTVFLNISVFGLFIACSPNGLEKKEVVNEELGYSEHFTVKRDTDVKEGIYKKIDSQNQVVEESNYVNGQLQGERKIFENGRLYSTETFLNGKHHGAFQSFHPEGGVYVEGEYVDGAMEGRWKTYYPTGQLKEIVHFDKNQENGPFIEFYPNGNTKAEGEYLDGDNEHGLLLLYNIYGVLIKKMQCEHGICRTTWEKETENNNPPVDQ